MQRRVAFAVAVVDVELLRQQHAQHFEVALKHRDHHEAVPARVRVLVVHLEPLHDLADLHALAGDDGISEAAVGLLVDLAHDSAELLVLRAGLAEAVSADGDCGGLHLLGELGEAEVDADAFFDVDDLAGDLEFFVVGEKLLGREFALRDLETLELGVGSVIGLEAGVVFPLDEGAESLFLFPLLEQPALLLEFLLLISAH